MQLAVELKMNPAKFKVQPGKRLSQQVTCTNWQTAINIHIPAWGKRLQSPALPTAALKQILLRAQSGLLSRALLGDGGLQSPLGQHRFKHQHLTSSAMQPGRRKRASRERCKFHTPHTELHKWINK